MIYALIALSIAGVVIALLAIITIVAIGRNSRLARDEQSLQRVVQDAQNRAAEWSEQATLHAQENDDLQRENQRYRESVATTIQALHNENRRLLQENVELNARSTALQEALEAKPTMPAKRVVRKNSTAGGEQTP